MMIDYTALRRLAPVPGAWYELNSEPIQVLLVLYATPPEMALGAYVPVRVCLREYKQPALPPNMPKTYAAALIKQLRQRERKTITMEEWLMAQPTRIVYG